MVSIKDVAAKAGVAISTVSKVLNNYPNVSEATKAKVLKAVEELNFVPNSVASALSSKKSGRVAILMNLDDSARQVDEIHMQCITGAITDAKDEGLDAIMVFYSMIKHMSLDEMIRYFKAQSITGLVVFGITKDDDVLRKLVESDEFVAVVVDAPVVSETTSCIWIDHEKAQYDVAKKTAEDNNCTRILYLSGEKNEYVTDKRLAGMKKLAKDMNYDLTVKCGKYSELEARKITFKNAEDTDMIVCASDLMAIGAMRALIEMDIFRPVCGFGGITLMGYAGKQMNTVKVDFRGIAYEAMKELKNLLGGSEGREIVYDYKLVNMQYEDVIS